MIARQNGARAILIIKPFISDKPEHEVVGNSGILSIAISEKMADVLLAPQNKTIAGLRDLLSSGDPKGLEHLFELTSPAKITVQVDRVIKQDNNIVGVFKSENPDAPWIFIGAHYDHLGYGEINSRSPEEFKSEIHNGADDNASGTAAVVELAEYFSGMKKDSPAKISCNLVFCLWSGEELGLLGSGEFAKAIPVDKDKIKAYLNFDMVGRMRNNKLDVQGLGSAEEWKSIIERKNVVSGFSLSLIDDPYLPTDATSFYLKGIPVVSFFTGVHPDYHTYLDDTESINFEDMQRVTKFASLVISQLMKPDQNLTYEVVKVKSKKSSKGGGLVSLGTIPAYAGSDEPGVEIQGVRPGGPAEKAGIMAEDRIMQLNGKVVNNIYDFMNILDELKADVETDVQVKRYGKIVDLKIVPEEKK